MVTDCSICHAFDPATIAPGTPHPEFKTFKAIWDTGATGCVISDAVVNACGLKPTGMTVCHGVHGPQQVETFRVNIGLPNTVAFANIEVTRGQLSGGADVLIGMNIITVGDFSITNQGGVTVFSFRMPSQTTHDYVKQQNLENLKQGPGFRKFKGGKRKP